MGKLVTQKMVAQHLDCSEQTVTTLCKKKVLPPSRKATGYDLDECRTAYLRYLRDIIDGKLHGKEADGTEQDPRLNTNAARVKLQFEQMERIRLQNAETQGRLVDVTDVRHAFSEATVLLAAALDGIAGKIAEGDAVLRAKLLQEHRRVREDYAARLTTYADTEDSGRVSIPTAEPEGVAVGRK